MKTVLCALIALQCLTAQTQGFIIRNATIITVSGPVIPHAIIAMRGGKIVGIRAGLAVPPKFEIVDGTGKYIMPGLVDAMTSPGFAQKDLKETGDAFRPQLRAIDGFNPFGDLGSGPAGPIRMKELLTGGVTTMYIAPAVMGGQGAVVKTAGPDLASLMVREPASINMSLATRTVEVATLRPGLTRAKEYERNRARNPSASIDPGMEAIGKLLKREIPARIRANSSTEIRNALSLAQEFSLDLILEGGAAAYEYRQALTERKIPVILAKGSEALAAKLLAAGVQTAMVPGGSSTGLFPDGSVPGLTEEQVLRSVTLVPAQILGVSQRVGSLEVGKDADLIVLDGPPLSVKTGVERIYVGGQLVHDRNAK